jgi:DNA-binding NtrC family response regulator
LADLTAEGGEVLVVDGDEKVQRGLAQLFTGAGLVPTVMSDPRRARALAREKFFPVAVIDLDTPAANEGLELVRWLKEESPITATFVICSSKVFESAVEAFRAGAVDIVVKSPDQVEHLKRRVLDVAAAARLRVADERLLEDALAVHEGFLKRLMDVSRRVAELEEQRLGTPSDSDNICHICVVEANDGWLFSGLSQLLNERPGYLLRHASSGSEAMDLAGRTRFNISLISDQLPDLPSKMVVSALKQQIPDTIAIVYSRPGGGDVGRAEIVEGSRAILVIAEFSDAGQMVARIDELREAQRRTAQERRYLAQFRQDNYDLLRRYAELKHKLKR